MTNQNPLKYLKIVPLKSEREKDLFAKWKHVLNLKRVSKKTVDAYNLDLQKLLQYHNPKKKI